MKPVCEDRLLSPIKLNIDWHTRCHCPHLPISSCAIVNTAPSCRRASSLPGTGKATTDYVVRKTNSDSIRVAFCLGDDICKQNIPPPPEMLPYSGWRRTGKVGLHAQNVPSPADRAAKTKSDRRHPFRIVMIGAPSSGIKISRDRRRIEQLAVRH